MRDSRVVSLATLAASTGGISWEDLAVRLITRVRWFSISAHLRLSVGYSFFLVSGVSYSELLSVPSKIEFLERCGLHPSLPCMCGVVGLCAVPVAELLTRGVFLYLLVLI